MKARWQRLWQKWTGRFRYILTMFRVMSNYGSRVFKIMFQGALEGHFFPFCRMFLHAFFKGSSYFVEKFTDQTRGYGNLKSPELERLKKLSQGIHSQLSRDGRMGFSVLVPVYHPRPDFFRKALESILDQTSPHMEVLVGWDGPQPPEVLAVVEDLKRSRGLSGESLRAIDCDRTQGGGISRTTNALARAARYPFLLLMDHDDWIRPDLLLRYEQVLRCIEHPEKTVLYCDEFKINEKDQMIYPSLLRKPDAPAFPYLFINWICHALLVPRALWESAGGLRSEFDGAQDYDLCLRLDLAGAEFRNIPVPLYAWRAHAASTAKVATQKSYASRSGLEALQEYVAQKKLDWDCEEGQVPTSYRAKPRRRQPAKIVALMPFRDEKEMTLRAADSLLKSTGVDLHLCAIDNRSQDRSIAQALMQRGVEVLRFDEPFNYSRMNNWADLHTTHGDEEYLLFINNDVEVEQDAIEEMSRWIDQPQVGMVGCKLYYPPTALAPRAIQHGGVSLRPEGPHFRMQWTHVDKGALEQFSGFSKVIQIVDAVTAACALVRRDHFRTVGGFDEHYYPIAFSDTDLAVKLRKRGLRCLQTPYARGIHHESVSRDYANIEDFEASRWLYHQLRVGDGPNPFASIRGVPEVEI